MRVLVTSTPGLGHIHPMVPLARALRDAGHEVVWASGAGSCERIAALGFRAVPAGVDAAARWQAMVDRRPDLPQLPPRARRSVVYPTMFGEVAAPVMFADVRAWLEADGWRPDVIVHEPCELASGPLAAMVGVPNVVVGFGGLIPPPLLDDAGAWLAPLWDDAGTAPSADAGLYDHLYLHPWPEGLGAEPTAPTVRRVRPEAFDGGGDDLPAWIDDLGRDRPCVYVTFGTEAAVPRPLPSVLAALGRLEIDALFTTGSADPATVTPAPTNVRVERYVPQRAVLDRAAVLVSHGGAGAVTGAARAGVGQVCLPGAADQFDNADDLAATGASVTVEPGTMTEDALLDAISHAMHDDALRRAATTLAEAIARLPDVTDAVTAIEALAG